MTFVHIAVLWPIISETLLDSLYLTPGLQWWMSAASDLLLHSMGPHYSSFQIQSGSESLCHNECWEICFPGPKQIMCLQTHRSLFISRLEPWLLALSLQQKRDGGIREREKEPKGEWRKVLFLRASLSENAHYVLSHPSVCAVQADGARWTQMRGCWNINQIALQTSFTVESASENEWYWIKSTLYLTHLYKPLCNISILALEC